MMARTEGSEGSRRPTTGAGQINTGEVMTARRTLIKTTSVQLGTKRQIHISETLGEGGSIFLAKH